MSKLHPSVLITHFHSSKNAGDRALLEVLLNDLRNALPSAHLTVLANWPHEKYFADNPDVSVLPSPWNIVGEGTGRSILQRVLSLWVSLPALLFYRVNKNSKLFRKFWTSWFALFDAYSNADFVIGVAGNPFYAMGKIGWPFPAIAWSVLLAHLFHRPFYSMPQSIGPFKRKWETWSLSQLYGRARQIFLREPVSTRLAAKIGIPRDKIQYAPDPAFAFKPASRDDAIEFLSRYGFQPGDSCLGATLIAPMGHALDRQAVERYYEAFASFFSAFLQEEKDAKIFIFNQVTGPTPFEDDRIAAQRVLDQLPDKSARLIWVKEELPPDVLKACYGLMDFFVASRLHSGIFALGMGVPTIFVGYLSKTKGVLEALNLADWGMELGEITPERFVQFCTSSWRDRTRRVSLLSVILPEVIAQAKQPVQWIVDDFLKNSLDTTNM